MAKQIVVVMMTVVLCAGAAQAETDTFGTGSNQFDIDFVTIEGDSGDLGNWPAGGTQVFSGVNRDDYRMATLEVTNDQWDKFRSELGMPVTGAPSEAYAVDALYWLDPNMPVHQVSWFEAAQFVNWLNTSTGHHEAYKFTGTQGTGDYTFAAWSPTEAYGGTNLYRHKDAFYYLPTEAEWDKASYWNGTALQLYATKPGDTLYQGNGSNGGWNYHDGDDGPDGPDLGPWAVGSGSEELNGTFDMMGNVAEWVEGPASSITTGYDPNSFRGLSGGSFGHYDSSLASEPYMGSNPPHISFRAFGFRVASEVPEPCSLGLLSLGGLALIKRRRMS